MNIINVEITDYTTTLKDDWKLCLYIALLVLTLVIICMAVVMVRNGIEGILIAPLIVVVLMFWLHTFCLAFDDKIKRPNYMVNNEPAKCSVEVQIEDDDVLNELSNKYRVEILDNKEKRYRIIDADYSDFSNIE